MSLLDDHVAVGRKSTEKERGSIIFEEVKRSNQVLVEDQRDEEAPSLHQPLHWKVLLPASVAAGAPTCWPGRSPSSNLGQHRGTCFVSQLTDFHNNGQEPNDTNNPSRLVLLSLV